MINKAINEKAKEANNKQTETEKNKLDENSKEKERKIDYVANDRSICKELLTFRLVICT